ncbi:hypothetical protein MCAP1_001033 [Malassezia caprae]|uniref:Uncharacterized protein n=1 Tax=Malassezia caprae TaxID=1381934 RepID=A0AAF0E3J4_9BASI|nr:hypothetical protein MCAP1_001033 [Malassezia caprae]
MAADMERVSQALAALPHAPCGAEGPSDVLSVAAPLLADLKRINREAYAHVAERRALVASARERADTQALALAGWQYEARELHERIDACRDLEPVYEQVLARARAPAPTEPTEVHAQLQASLEACRRWEQDVRALESEASELQKQSYASHRSLVRMEKDLATLQESVHKMARS